MTFPQDASIAEVGLAWNAGLDGVRQRCRRHGRIDGVRAMRDCRSEDDVDDAGRKEERVVPRGLEPRTLRLLAVRSNQLSYETHDI